MELYQIKGHHDVAGSNRMPDIREHLKLAYWNNDVSSINYDLPQNLFDYLVDATFEGNTLTITKSNGDIVEVDIIITKSALGLELPGDTKILFDRADTISGESNFIYDYINHRVVLVDSNGIYGKDSVFDTAPKSILQYIGNNNLLINFGSTKIGTANMHHNLQMGLDALGALIAGDNNIAIGRKAGANIASTMSGSIFIGPYAGRLAQDSNQLFIHNADFTTLQDFIEKSLIHGDFALGILNVNNRLAVREEVKIGTFNGVNTPDGGMIQFVDAGGGLVKPQYYDETNWVDFANGLNYYTDDATLTPIDEYTNKLTLHVVGFGDVEVNIPDTHLTVAGAQGNLQFNNGADDLGASANLSFDSTTNLLTLNGSIALGIQTLAAYQNVTGAIVNTGAHIYAKLNDGFVQLDNERTDGEVNHGESVGDSIKVYAGLNIINKNLQFYDLKGGDRININDANEFGNIIIDLDYIVNGTNLGEIGVPIYVSTTDTINSSTLGFKRLYSSNNSVLITEYANYIDLAATVEGVSGESNNGANVGTGEGRVWDEIVGKAGTNILFRTIKKGTNVNIDTNTGTRTVDISVDPFVVDAEQASQLGYTIYNGYTGTDQRTLSFNNVIGANGIVASLTDNLITFELDETLLIPNVDGVILPVVTNTNKTLTWHIDYDADVRNSNPVTKEILQFNLGSNIIYNPVTNTLDAIGGSGDKLDIISNTSITRNVDGSVNRVASNRNVKFINESGVFVTWDGESDLISGLGWLAFENDFPIATIDTAGMVKPGDNVTIELDGTINVNIPDIPESSDAVLYDTVQALLHDGDQDLTTIVNNETLAVRRARARANIGAAYVNGSALETFLAAGIDVNQPIPGGDRGLILRDNYIRSEWGHVQLMNDDGADHISTFSVGNGVAELTLDPRGIPGGLAAFNIYMYNAAGTKVKVASLKGRYEDGELRADLRIKGDLKFRCTDAEMEA